MPKISKNIKKFRNAKKMTQDVLAEKLHVTRQAISNWENDKTKPDIESLEALAGALDVQIEELIYGEKRETIISQDRTKEKNRIKIILAIIGSLFVASGVALVFFGFWQNFTLPLQTILSILPMLIGQAVAVLIFLKKKGNIQFCEGASIIWTVGIVSTIALVDYIYDISWVYTDYLLVDLILILPVMFILNAVSPLILYYYMTIHIAIIGNLQSVIFSMIFFAVGVVFTYFLSRNKEDFRGKYAQWVTVIASIPLIMIYNYALFKGDIIDEYVLLFVGCLVSYFLSMFILTPHNTPFSLPYKPISIAGLCITLMALTFACAEFISSGATTVIFMVLMVIIPLVICVIKRDELNINISKLIVAVVPLATLFVSFVLSFIELGEAKSYTIAVLSIIFGGSLVYYGIKELKLLPINFGLITAFVQSISIFGIMGYGDIFVLGILLAIFGAVIIVLNWKMLSLRKNLKEKNGGGDDNE